MPSQSSGWALAGPTNIGSISGAEALPYAQRRDAILSALYAAGLTPGEARAKFTF
jgi:hypothetical protein